MWEDVDRAMWMMGVGVCAELRVLTTSSETSPTRRARSESQIWLCMLLLAYGQKATQPSLYDEAG